ncbi:hypothetical protein ES703_15760 [subsurface metagenome]
MLARGVNVVAAIYDAHRARKSHNQRSSDLKDLSEKIGREHTSVALLGPPEENATHNTLGAESPPRIANLSIRQGTACVPCCSDHFSTCAGLISDEAMRMVRRKGIQDQEVIQRILACSDQLNAMERDDLAPSKIQELPPWEKELAIYAQNKGAEIRHLLNNISSVEDLEKAATEIKQARDYIGSEWHKGRLAGMGVEEKKTIGERAQAIRAKLGEPEPELTLEDAKTLAAEEATQEVERQWQSAEKI